nr:Chain D, Histone-lysine N-methyltransferase MLL3 [Homo sapiens]
VNPTGCARSEPKMS